MLIINADFRGLKRENEKITVYAQDLKRGRTIDSAGLEELTDKVYAQNPITDNLGRIRVFSLTRQLSRPDAIKLMDALRNETKYERVGFRILKREGYHIYAEGKKADLKQLPNQFTLGGDKSLSTRGWIKRNLNLPFSTLQKVQTTAGDKYYVAEKLTLDEFLRLRSLSWDTEFMHWWEDVKLDKLNNEPWEIRKFLGQFNGHNEAELEGMDKRQLVQLVENHFNNNVGNAAMGYHEQPMTSQMGEIIDGQNVVHYFEHLSGKTETFELDLSVGKTTNHNHREKDARELAIAMQKFFDEHPSLVLLTQNGMSYDSLKVAEYVNAEIARAKQAGEETELKPFTMYGHKPKIESSAAFYKKVILPLFHVDFAPYSQYNLPFTVNNKFVTIMSMILGKKIEKKETYDDLKRSAIEQMIAQFSGGKGGEESAALGREYGNEDALTLNQAASYIMTQLYFKSRLFKRNPEDICCTSKAMLAQREFEFEHVIQTLRPVGWNKDKRQRYQKMDSAEEFRELVGNDTIKAMRKNNRVGVMEGGMYYIAPFTQIYNRMLRRNKVVQEIFNHIRGREISPDESSTQRTLERFDLIHSIEEGFLLPYIFESSCRDFRDVDSDRVEKTIGQFKELVGRYYPINQSGNFYCFPREFVADAEFQEAIKGIGFLIAQGRLISAEPGSFQLHDGINVFKREIDVKGTAGFKTIYQEEMIKELVDIGFSDDPLHSIDYVKEFTDRLRAGDVDRDKLIHFKKQVVKDYFDYSSYAQRQDRIKAYIQFSMEKGQQFAKIKLADGWKSLEEYQAMSDNEVFTENNIEFLIDAYLGPRTTRGRSWQKGKIGRYLRPLIQSEEFSDKDVMYYLDGRYDEDFGTVVALLPHIKNVKNLPVSEQMELFR